MFSAHHRTQAATVAASGFLTLSSTGAALAAPATIHPAAPTTTTISSKGIEPSVPRHARSVPPLSSENGFDAPIYHDSRGWEWLNYPGKVVPGGRITNITQDTNCSAGWIVGRDNRIFILTAGHCGKRGDQFSITAQNGNRAIVGEMVESIFLQTGNADFGLVEIYRRSLPYVDAKIPFKEDFYGAVGLQLVERNNWRVCHLGYRTGQSCGAYLGSTSNGIFQFRGYVDHGDSGGPVYSVIDNTVNAFGIISYRQPMDATRVGAQSIEPAMKHWGLKIYR